MDGDENSPRILIFCSNTQKDLLKSSDYWLADGTFSVVEKTMFYQLFIITGVTQTGVTVPCLFALLPNKESTSYQEIFQFLKDNGIDAPPNLKTDFEKAIIKAFLNVYPGATVRGCDVHYKRAIRTKLSSTDYGLGSLYLHNVEFQTLVRYLWSLSLVPESDIISVWENYISQKYESLKPGFEEDGESVDEFLGYFERTWLGALNWRTGARKQPIFKHALWNKYSSVLEDDPTTSNSAEGFNGALALSMPRNCSLWMLIQQLRTEENNVVRKIRDASVCSNLNSSRNLGRAQKHADLKNVVSTYNKVPLGVYMDSLIGFFNS